MSQTNVLSEERKVSLLAEELKGSEIIKLAAEINGKIAAGEKIYNFTIGDFNPEIFPIPGKLKKLVQEAYQANQTNYPASNGIFELREAVANFIREEQGLDYSAESYLISGGARPLIYAAYQAILDPNEDAIFPVPSWNNNHYTTLTKGKPVAIQTRAEDFFMPTARELKGHLKSAGIVALCSPLNPTGTVFSEKALRDICKAIVSENKRRKGKRKPLYLIYDQIYWQLCHGKIKHYDPVNLVPEMRDYTIYIDGLSKAFASTGVRVGWAFGPDKIIAKMKSILSHVGAWAPKPEQVAVSNFLSEPNDAKSFLGEFKQELHKRLKGFYELFKSLKAEGFPVDVIAPKAAIYLTVKIDLVGMKRLDGVQIESVREGTQYLLDEAGIALVPFSAFGASENSNWYRLSVGTARMKDIEEAGHRLREALKRLEN